MFWSYFLEGLIYLLLFIGVDILAEKYKIEGRYYLSHTICNLFVTILTYNDLIYTYFNFSNFINYPMNYGCYITFSLLAIIWYFKKLDLRLVTSYFNSNSCITINNVYSSRFFIRTCLFTMCLPGGMII